MQRDSHSPFLHSLFNDFLCMGNIYTITTTGETPAKKNSRINLRNGVSIPSKRYMEWHQKALSEIKNQITLDTPIDKPVLLHLEFIHGDLRRRDSDNGCSSICDLLVDAAILKDDNWQIVRDIAITNKYEKGNPRCNITIQDL